MPVYDAARDMSPAAVEARLKAAEAMIHDLCNGSRRWMMSIPARPDYDPDLVIADALRDISELRQAHARRVSELLEANNLEVERRRAAEDDARQARTGNAMLLDELVGRRMSDRCSADTAWAAWEATHAGWPPPFPKDAFALGFEAGRGAWLPPPAEAEEGEAVEPTSDVELPILRTMIGDGQPLYDDDARRLLARMDRAEGALAWRPTHRHRKRGTSYQEIGRGRLQASGMFGPTEGDLMVVYRGADGVLWIRAASEFDDGRFEPIEPPAAPPPGDNQDMGLATDEIAKAVAGAPWPGLAEGEEPRGMPFGGQSN